MGKYEGPQNVVSARNTFAHNLRRTLFDKDITQSELAKRTGLAASTISSYMSGDRYPRPEQMRVIADTLGVTVGSLTGVTPVVVSEQDELLRLYNSLEPLDRAMVMHMCRFLVREETNDKNAPDKPQRVSVTPRKGSIK